jgi:hypothetical protein
VVSEFADDVLEVAGAPVVPEVVDVWLVGQLP